MIYRTLINNLFRRFIVSRVQYREFRLYILGRYIASQLAINSTRVISCDIKVKWPMPFSIINKTFAFTRRIKQRRDMFSYNNYISY